jgi:hypothetical protein
MHFFEKFDPFVPFFRISIPYFQRHYKKPKNLKTTKKIVRPHSDDYKHSNDPKERHHPRPSLIRIGQNLID